MLNLKTIALAAALALSVGAGSALAEESALDALSSATSVSFATVAAGAPNAIPGAEQVDLDSLKARIQGDPKLLAQLEAYGASIDDVVGISGSDETDVTIYVQG